MGRSENPNDAITELQDFLPSPEEMGRFTNSLQENQDRNYKELQGTIEYMTKMSRLLESTERKHKFIGGAWDDIQLKALQDVMVLEGRNSEVESELRVKRMRWDWSRWKEERRKQKRLEVDGCRWS